MLKDWPGKIDPFSSRGMRLLHAPGFPPGFLVGACCATLILIPLLTFHVSERVPNQVVDAAARPFVDRLGAGDADRAYTLTAPEFQQLNSPETLQRFSGILSRNTGKIDVVKFEGLSTAAQPASPTVYAFYKLYGQSGDARVRVLMSRHAGAWQVVGFTLEPLSKRAVARKGSPAS